SRKRGKKSMTKANAPKLLLARADELRDDPDNARVHSDEQVRHIADLIERFGFTRPIMVDLERDKTIVVGHGARRAAQMIYAAGGVIHAAPGKDRGGVELPSGTVPILDVSGWTEEERRAVNLSDNRSGELSEWDPRRLALNIDALTEAGVDLALVGFDGESLDELLAGIDAGSASPALPPEEFPEFGEDIETEHRCPKCGYEWSGKAS